MNPLPVFAAGALAMASAFFGVVMSRVFWAEDLKHALYLRQIWDRQEATMQSQIDALQRTIKFKDTTLAIQDQTLATQDQTLATQDQIIKVLKGEAK